MTVALEPLAVGGLTTTLHLDDNKIRVAYTGSADMESVEPLTAHLAALHAESQRAHAPEVRIDFRQLEFMSSSCLKAFVEWISNIQDLAPVDRYRITFLSNPHLRWQKRSLMSLQCFASDLITVVDG